jgi:hypothetical protein
MLIIQLLRASEAGIGTCTDYVTLYSWQLARGGGSTFQGILDILGDP